MHNRLFVTLRAAAGARSDDVRHAAYDRLVGDASYCNDRASVALPPCDWFVIGGRWSGLLASAQMGGAFDRAVCDRIPEMAAELLTMTVIDRHTTGLDALWQSLGGQGPSPYSRNSHEDFGYPDDAMLLTAQLYSALLAEYEGQGAPCNSYADLDAEALGPGFIGRKWIVVVDYHN